MTGLLVGASFVVACIGFLLLNQASAGVGFIAGAVLLAIYARLAQAGEQHRTHATTAESEPTSPPLVQTMTTGQKVLIGGCVVAAIGLLVVAVIWGNV